MVSGLWVMVGRVDKLKHLGASHILVHSGCATGRTSSPALGQIVQLLLGKLCCYHDGNLVLSLDRSKMRTPLDMPVSI